jgi:GNAT superfamily N-acetyltransferase
MPTFTVAPADAGTVDALALLLGQRQFFADRLAAQSRSEGVLLVGRLDGTPVGDVWVSFSPAPEAEVNEFLPGVPMLVHLEVVAPLRGRGYGTSIIGAAEDVIRSNGHDRVTLGVGIDNPRARRLYERLGYVEWAHGVVHTGYDWAGDDGVSRRFPETIAVLVKSLR